LAGRRTAMLARPATNVALPRYVCSGLSASRCRLATWGYRYAPKPSVNCARAAHFAAQLYMSTAWAFLQGAEPVRAISMRRTNPGRDCARVAPHRSAIHYMSCTQRGSRLHHTPWSTYSAECSRHPASETTSAHSRFACSQRHHRLTRGRPSAAGTASARRASAVARRHLLRAARQWRARHAHPSQRKCRQAPAIGSRRTRLQALP